MKTHGYVKDITRIFFKLQVYILLIILFNPRQQNMIDTETKLILYLYGILTINGYGVNNTSSTKTFFFLL